MSAERIDVEALRGHTPGPWKWWDSCSFRRLSHEGDGDVLAPVVQQSDGHPDVHFRNGGYTGPDARLIAAAPALLAEVIERRAREAQLIEALESIRQYGSDTLSGNAEGPTDREWFRESVREMRLRSIAALKAIRGTQP